MREQLTVRPEQTTVDLSKERVDATIEAMEAEFYQGVDELDERVNGVPGMVESIERAPGDKYSTGKDSAVMKVKDK